MVQIRSSSQDQQQQQSREMQQELEEQQKRQMQEHQQQIQSLREALSKSQSELEEARTALDNKAIELQSIQADLANQQAAHQEQKRKLEEISHQQETQMEEQRKVKTVEQATSQQLQAYQQYRTKKMTNILDVIRAQKAALVLESTGKAGTAVSAGGPSTVPSSATEARLNVLQDQHEKLRTDLREKEEQLKRTTHALNASEATSTARLGRIERLEKDLYAARESLNHRLDSAQTAT